MDPDTLEVIPEGVPTSCVESQEVAFSWFSYPVRYNRKAGTLRRTAPYPMLKDFYHGTADDFNQLLPHRVFHSVMMYSWADMQEEITLNDIFNSLNMNQDIQATLGKEPIYQRATSSDSITNGNAAGGIPAGIVGLAEAVSNPFHVWVALTCVIANGVVFYYCLKSARHVYHTDRVQRWVTSGRRKVRKPSVDERVGCAEEVEVPLQDVISRSIPQVNEVAEESQAVIQIKINGQAGSFLFDSGASISLVAPSFLHALGTAFTYSSDINALSVNGDPLLIVGEVMLSVGVGSNPWIDHTFKVFPNCKHDGILGIDLIEKFGPTLIDIRNRRVKIGHEWYRFRSSNGQIKLKVAVLETTNVPARTMVVLEGTLSITVQEGT